MSLCGVKGSLLPVPLVPSPLLLRIGKSLLVPLEASEGLVLNVPLSSVGQEL